MINYYILIFVLFLSVTACLSLCGFSQSFKMTNQWLILKRKKKHACIFSPQRYFFFVLLLAALHVFCAYSVPPFEGLAQSWMSVINLGWVQPCFAYFFLHYESTWLHFAFIQNECMTGMMDNIVSPNRIKLYILISLPLSV